MENNLIFEQITKDQQKGLKLLGQLDETLDVNQLESNLKNCTFLDLQDITTLSSMGIAIWIRFFRDYFKRNPSSQNMKLENCSFHVVEQFSYLPEFIHDFEVASVVVPFICGTCENEFSDIEIIRELKKKDDYYELSKKCPLCGEDAELSYFCDNYFYFLEDEYSSL